MAIAMVLGGLSWRLAAPAGGMDRQMLRDWATLGKGSGWRSQLEWLAEGIRSNADGLAGLADRPRPGRRPLYRTGNGPRLPCLHLRRGRRECRHGRGRESLSGKDIEALNLGPARSEMRKAKAAEAAWRPFNGLTMPPPNRTGYEIRQSKKKPQR